MSFSITVAVVLTIKRLIETSFYSVLSCFFYFYFFLAQLFAYAVRFSLLWPQMALSVLSVGHLHFTNARSPTHNDCSYTSKQKKIWPLYSVLLL